MKKIILASCFLISIFSFAEINNLPDNIEKSICSEVSSYSGAERRNNYNWYKDSYLELIKRLDKSGIPKIDKEVIMKRLESMYGKNYPKQLSRINDEINDYKSLVKRIEEEQKIVQQKIEYENAKSKEEIEIILASSSIPKADLDRIEKNAKEEYSNNYSLQKAYIKGAIKTYNDLKK